ncbi:GcvT family protein [Nocardioides coralli]|uniref:GcvT family protein n=1 Tax=Nocardioides coralli TaxID=2872154 RepID=UPI001CA3DFD3|nr:FAD-dependent oxidoreductase [Nocardioides coralli]QZY29775.1 FAD-dependent oxidoreductase [Nocardioides coralli]
MSTLPERSQVVIVGGGVIGASVAYHLARLGWTDVVLLEQGELSCGTTWHAAGLVGLLRTSQTGTELVQYSTDLYRQLEDEVGLATGYKQNGGLILARTDERLVQLRRTAAAGAAYGMDAELISPEQAAEHWPLISTDGLVGALWLPGDGTANPTDLTQSLAKGARDRGVRILEGVRVTGITSAQGAVTGVETDAGYVETEVVVNCAGQWAAQVGAMCGVTVPLHSAEHFYVVTDQIEGVHSRLPILRDPDGWSYFKEEVGGLVVGGFEPEAKPWVAPADVPYPFSFQLLEEDWEQFSIVMENAVERIPALEKTGIRQFYNGPESFTPDNNFLLGAAPELRGFYVGAGFNSVGIASAGGAGRALAEWIVEGEPTSDLHGVDIRRFSAADGNPRWLRERVVEVLGMHYRVPWPTREMQRGRGLRRSPTHQHLADAGAVFGTKNGWERALFFQPGAQEQSHGWGKPDWLEACAAEQRATHSAVAVFDQTSFSKYSLLGRDAVEVLQWLCTADVDVAPGRTVYTGMLNARGCYEADVTVTRVAGDEFLVFSTAGAGRRDLDWIRRHVDADQRCTVVDATNSLATYGVMGPGSRELLSQLTDDDLSDEAFPFGTSRLLPLGHALVRATRLTYVGELGWEVSVPTEYAAGVYETLMEAGRDVAVPAGYHAIDALRLEKGYRAFGRELTPDYGPVHAGLSFTCDLSSDRHFLGREQVERAKADGVTRRLLSLRLTDPDAMIWGGELLTSEGAACGQVTSAAWSDELGACVGLAWVWAPDHSVLTLKEARERDYDVDVAGTSVAVEVSSRSLVDPDNERIR